MIDVDAAAAAYFRKLLAQQQDPGMAIRMRAVAPGTPQADCRLEYCEPDEIGPEDYAIEQDGFTLVVDRASMPFLESARLHFEADATGGQMTVVAPGLKGRPPGADASLVERVQHLLDAEINPQIASHGGRVSLVAIEADGVAVLRFGGGCQGCAQVDVTLKQGVERTLLGKLPELTGVRDVTDHAAGTAPYYRR